MNFLPQRSVICNLFVAAIGSILAATGFADHHLADEKQDEGWVSLFNGEDLTGWKVGENPDTFKVVDGILVVKGPRAHAFYVGDVNDANFKNFEWKCEIMTKPKSNSGMYFHTEYQERGWPEKGYEAQINATHGDPRKTGSLYAVEDVMNQAPHRDNEWFTQHVIVRDKHIIIKVNDKVTVDYTEPEDVDRGPARMGRLISSGTVALQGHDPGSEVHFRKIMIKPLDD